MEMNATQKEQNDLVGVVEKLLKFGALFGIFGYLSARAHWNHLGISSMTWLGVDYYLMEFGIFLVTSLLNMSIFMAILILIAGGFAALRRRIRRASSAQVDANGGWFHSYGGLLTLTVLLYAYQFGLLVFMVMFSRQSVAVGTLKIGLLTPSSSALVNWAVFYATVSLCIAAYALQRQLSGRPGLAWIRGLLILACIMLFAWSPLIYGSFLRISNYPLIRIETTDSPKKHIAGLLVLDTPGGLEYWQAENRVGRMVLIPHNRVASITLGKTCNLCELAAYASKNGGKYPE